MVRAVLEGFPGHAFVLDSDDRVLLWNSGGGRMHEWPPGEGPPLASVLPVDEDWARRALECLAETGRTGEPGSFGPVTVRSPDGAMASFRVRALPVEDADARTVLLVDDTRVAGVESRVRTKEQGLAAVHEMVTMLGHEFRNPLTAIRSAVQVLARRLGVGSRESLICHQITAQVDRLSATLEDLMLLEAPMLPQPTPLAVCDLIESSVRLASDKFPELRDRLTIDNDLELIVTTLDPMLVEQALFHVLSNASEASRGEGAIRLRVELRGAGLVFSVADEGPGFPPDISRALEPFFTTKPAGSGLGLPTARKILRAHGGTLSIRNLPEGGAEVTLSFSVDPRSIEEAESGQTAAKESGSSKRKKSTASGVARRRPHRGC